MPQDIRIWTIEKNNDLREISKTKLNLEEYLENWLEIDISIISNEMLVIGRQVETIFGGVVDLLCLDSKGDIVIVELKRDKTPREITAQTLDYASWINDLSNERITEIANNYLGDNGPLEEAFQKQFNIELPEILNENHEMLIVASEIDPSTERIVTYLSDTYGVPINAVTFQYFQDENQSRFLARVFLMEPSLVEYKTQTKTTSKRKPPLSSEDLLEIAKQKGVGEMYTKLVNVLDKYFDRTGTTRSSFAFLGIMDEHQLTIFSVIPGESNSNDGLRFQVYGLRFEKYFGIDVTKLLPGNIEKWEYYENAPATYRGYAGFFKDFQVVEQFLNKMDEITK